MRSERGFLAAQIHVVRCRTLLDQGSLVLLLLLTSHVSLLTSQEAPSKKIQASLERVFGAGATADTVQVDSAAVLRVHRADSLLGFAVVRNSKGKDQPITYLIAVDSASRLKDVDILVYREPYGGEVAYDSWRKQFRGKTAQDPLQVGQDIRSISGATISVNSVTLGVRRAVAELTAWRAAGKL